MQEISHIQKIFVDLIDLKVERIALKEGAVYSG